MVVFLAVVLVVLVLGVLALGDFSALAGVVAFLANLARAALRREAVFFFIRSFLTALSNSDWALERFSRVGLALKALSAVLMAFLISWL